MIAIISLNEFLNLSLKVVSKNPIKNITLFVGLSVYVLYTCANIGLIDNRFLLLIIPLILLILISALYLVKDNAVQVVSISIFGLIYTITPYVLAQKLAVSSVGGVMSFSPWILLSIFVFQWINDTGAYVVGMTMGKHKIFPRISPKKSIEGAVGGTLFTIAASYPVWLLTGELSLLIFVAVAVIVSIFGVFGDFVESMFKRHAGIKDSGNIIPGHGGILDRFDGAMFSIPMVYAFLYLMELL